MRQKSFLVLSIAALVVCVSALKVSSNSALGILAAIAWFICSLVYFIKWKNSK
ncbi:hypothetical protein ACER0A_000795 [Haloimpatiens sp. FM7315]|uniref:hypothetical protein n=1 Tax=Haloimpatiens sp. FM7315 TaxID=3298609 RepID=UPI0035A30756